MHFLDARVMINMILCFNIQANFHIEMTNIVNNSHEFWHLISWDSFIRTYENDFAKYNDESSIIFFDIVKYFCEKDMCKFNYSFHCDQVFFFDRDKRSQSKTHEKVTFKIWSLIINDERTFDVSSSFTLNDKEYLLIENFVREILSNNVVNRRFDIVFSRNQNHETRFFINHILNNSRRFLKRSNLVASVRKKLELKTFDKKWLIRNLNQKMLSFFLLIFIDEFDLYRNVYHFVSDIYAMSIAFCELKKQKNSNTFILILSLHEEKLNDVVNCFQIDLKIIDRDCFLNINEEQIFVWSFVVTFLEDMKQQQTSTEFFSSRATFSCRFCDIEFEDWNNLHWNIVSHDRYHHDVLILRQ
jgi:hypothetical protein